MIHIEIVAIHHFQEVNIEEKSVKENDGKLKRVHSTHHTINQVPIHNNYKKLHKVFFLNISQLDRNTCLCVTHSD